MKDYYEIDQNPKRIRERIRSKNGPDRKQLPLIYPLGKLTEAEFSSLTNDVDFLIRTKSKNHNDLDNQELYQLAKGVSKIFNYFPKQYRQYLFQATGERPKNSPEIPEEWEFTEYLPNTECFEKYISKFAQSHFRSRLAVVPVGEVIDWHIDSNTSYACRGMIIVQGIQKFMVKKQKEIHEQIMHPGEAWFCNTGYRHRVETIGSDTRLSLLFSCHYNAIKNTVPCSN